MLQMLLRTSKKVWWKYYNLRGDLSYTGIAVFDIWKDLGVYWGIAVTAPEGSIYAPLRDLRNNMIIGAIVFMLVVVFAIWWVVKVNVTTRIRGLELLLHLLSVFKS